MKFLKNKMILEIAEANSSEASEIIEYTKLVGKETDNLLIDASGIHFTVAEEEAYIEKSNASINNKLFIGRIDKKIVSIAGINGSPAPRVQHNVTLGISVLKAYWNIGVATEMVTHVLNYCRMMKEIQNVTLEVRKDNEQAIKLYKKQGFKEVGTFTNKYLIDGKSYDALIMEYVK